MLADCHVRFRLEYLEPPAMSSGAPGGKLLARAHMTAITSLAGGGSGHPMDCKRFARVILGQGQLHRAKKELCGIRPEGILAAALVSNHHAVPIRPSHGERGWDNRARPHPHVVLVLNRVARSALVQHGAEGKR